MRKQRKVNLSPLVGSFVLLAGVLSSIFSASVFASPTWHTSTIKQIYPLSDGGVVLIFNSDSASCTNGNSPKYYSLSISENGVSDAGFKNIYSIALVAAASAKQVTINFESNTSACYINRLLVNF